LGNGDSIQGRKVLLGTRLNLQGVISGKKAHSKKKPWGTGITGLTTGLAILPHSNQKLLAVKARTEYPR